MTKHLLPYDLRCEDQATPLAIQEPQPLLSWRLHQGPRGWTPSGWQVIAATTPERLHPGLADLWESGLHSGDAVNTPWEGSSLKPGTTVYWTVRLFERHGVPGPWSAPTSFETGPSSGQTWGSTWIGNGSRGHREEVGSVIGAQWMQRPSSAETVVFSRDFQIPEGIPKATAPVVAALSGGTRGTYLEIALNGKWIATGLAGEGAPAVGGDLAAHLRVGHNRLSILVRAGSPLPWSLAVSMTVILPDQQICSILSDPLWRFRFGEEGWKDPSNEVGWLSVEGCQPVRNDRRDHHLRAVIREDPSPAPHLRKAFTVPGICRRARLYVCGIGAASVRLNGKAVAQETLRDPGYTAFDRRLLAVAHDVTHLIQTGANVLGAILGTGWYDVHDHATWFFHRAPWRGRPRLLARLEIALADGGTVVITSDATWQTAPGPILRDGIYTGEIHDARKSLDGWSKPGFDARAWAPCVIMDPPGGKLCFRSCPPVQVTRTLIPMAITKLDDDRQVVDFGEHFAGHVRLKVIGDAGRKITLRYGEQLGSDGGVDTTAIDLHMEPRWPRQPFQTDVYICHGNGREIWEPLFSVHGFRYVEICGWPGDIGKADIEGQYAHTAVQAAGGFLCSDPVLNRLQEACVRSWHSNAQSIPTDCPQREKNGWTGDVHLAVEAGLMNFRSATFYRKWLDDLADAQRGDGGIPVIVPTSGWGNGDTWPGPVNPAWDSAYAIIAWDLLRYTGNDRPLRQHFPNLDRYVRFLATHLNTEGLLPDFTLGDWLPWGATDRSGLVSSVYMVHVARITADAALRVGQLESHRWHLRLAERSAKAVANAMAGPGPRHQCLLAMALHYRLLSGELRHQAERDLVANVERKGHIDAGILGAKYVLRVLSDLGRTDLALRLVRRSEKPGWGWWLAAGATTLWEDWHGQASLNHVMFADVSNWMMQSLGGIGLQSDSAFRHVAIRPWIDGSFQEVQCWHDGPRGRIRVRWRRHGERIDLKIALPPGTTGTVHLPFTRDQIKMVGLNPLTDITANGNSGCQFFISSGLWHGSISALATATDQDNPKELVAESGG